MKTMLTLFWVGVGATLAAPFAALRWLYRLLVSPKAEVASSVTPVTPVPIPHLEIEPSVIKVVRFGPREQFIGEITLWMRPRSGHVERAVRFTDNAYIARYGARKLRLPNGQFDRYAGQQQAIKEAIRQVEMLCGIGQTALPPSKPSPTLERASAAQPKGAVRNKAEWSEHSGTTKSPTEVYRGRFIKAGWDTRTISGEQKQQYFADLSDPALNGSIVRTWGNDLERAIAESGAKAGDMVCISMVGRAGKKKIYEVTR